MTYHSCVTAFFCLSTPQVSHSLLLILMPLHFERKGVYLASVRVHINKRIWHNCRKNARRRCPILVFDSSKSWSKKLHIFLFYPIQHIANGGYSAEYSVVMDVINTHVLSSFQVEVARSALTDIQLRHSKKRTRPFINALGLPW